MSKLSRLVSNLQIVVVAKLEREDLTAFDRASKSPETETNEPCKMYYIRIPHSKHWGSITSKYITNYSRWAIRIISNHLFKTYRMKICQNCTSWFKTNNKNDSLKAQLFSEYCIENTLNNKCGSEFIARNRRCKISRLTQNNKNYVDT